MARPGISLEDVERAVADLEARGETVTYLSVLDTLGEGSLTTIGRHLKAIRSREGLNSSLRRELPSEVETTYRTLMEQLWQQAQTSAALDVETLRRAANARVELMEQELDQVSVQYDVKCETLSQTTARLAETQQNLRTLEQALAVSEGEKAALEKQLSTLASSMEAQAAKFERWMTQAQVPPVGGKAGKVGSSKAKEPETN